MRAAAKVPVAADVAGKGHHARRQRGHAGIVVDGRFCGVRAAPGAEGLNRKSVTTVCVVNQKAFSERHPGTDRHVEGWVLRAVGRKGAVVWRGIAVPGIARMLGINTSTSSDTSNCK